MMPKNYFSYLMRVWRSEESFSGGWFASLEDPNTQETIQFKSMNDLFSFLEERSVARESPPVLQDKGCESVDK